MYHQLAGSVFRADRLCTYAGTRASVLTSGGSITENEARHLCCNADELCYRFVSGADVDGRGEAFLACPQTFSFCVSRAASVSSNKGQEAFSETQASKKC